MHALSLTYFTRRRYDSESWRRVRICRRQREALSNLNLNRIILSVLTALSRLKPFYTCEILLDDNLLWIGDYLVRFCGCKSFKALFTRAIFLDDFLYMHLHIIGSVETDAILLQISGVPAKFFLTLCFLSPLHGWYIE